MSIHRWDAKRDDNEQDIVDALEKATCVVERTSKPVDLIVWSPFIRQIMLLEVKHPKRTKRRDMVKQSEFIAKWQAAGALVVRVTSVEHALVVVGARDGEAKQPERREVK